MKKYLFGVFAIALAVGFSAFTNTSKVTGFYRASLNNPLQATSASYVQNKSNWTVDKSVEISLTDLSCTSGTVKACEMIVDINDLDVNDKPAGSITAAQGTSTRFIVSQYAPSDVSFNHAVRNQP